MIAAAKLDPSIAIPPRSLDMGWVEQQIRRFLADPDKQDMTFPACDKGTRKKLHHLAPLFELKSRSKDGELGRYTTLIKKKGSGKNIDEREVARMMKEFEFSASYDVSDDDLDGGGKSKGKSKGKGKGKDKGKSKGKEKDKGKGKGKGKLREKDQPGHLRTKEGDVVGHVSGWPFIGSGSPCSYLKCLTSPGCTKDRRGERWVHYAGVDGLVEWRDHWVVWGLGCSNHSSHQENETRVGCKCEYEVLITGS